MPQKQTSYDSPDVVKEYLRVFNTTDDTECDQKVRRLLLSVLKEGSILDIGCGAGMFIELVSPEPHRYVGIDPSRPMVQAARDRYPDHNTVCASFEDYADSCVENGEKFGNVVCIYGSLNYVPDSHLNKINLLVEPSGCLFLMFFSEAYVVTETEKRLGVSIPHYEHSADRIEELFGVRPVPFGNYMIIIK
jgi:SAM-dependent methyltransferase